jgi:hypothetical protein
VQLRAELMPPKVAKKRLAEIQSRIHEIEAAFETKIPADQLVKAFNELTGRDYEEDDFRNYWRSRSIEEFALQASRPPAGEVSAVTRDELIEILSRALQSAHDQDAWLEVFDANTYADASNLLFWPSDYDKSTDMRDYDPTPEQIVDQVLAKMKQGPIMLSDQAAADPPENP